jgi:hypothetical protein
MEALLKCHLRYAVLGQEGLFQAIYGLARALAQSRDMLQATSMRLCTVSFRQLRMLSVLEIS